MVLGFSFDQTKLLRLSSGSEEMMVDRVFFSMFCPTLGLTLCPICMVKYVGNTVGASPMILNSLDVRIILLPREECSRSDVAMACAGSFQKVGLLRIE